MNCYAWKIPEGCYSYALAEREGCGSSGWWWIAAAVAAGLLIFGGKKTKPRRVAKKR